MDSIQIVDCPRDAIQGIAHFIPTSKKIAYLNKLLASGLFDCIDFGSFVSPKAVPQLQDTAAVLAGLVKNEKTKLLAIIANIKGAEIAAGLSGLDYLGYPFSISESFQQRNTNASIDESFYQLMDIQELLAREQGKELVVYISMAFGNPYGDFYNPELVLEWMDRIQRLGVKRFAIADTTAEGNPDSIYRLFSLVKQDFPDLALSIHLHSRVTDAFQKVEAAHAAGCRTFEGALLGYGGCPFAQDELVGNIPTEMLLARYKHTDEAAYFELLAAFQELISNDKL